MTRRDVRKSDTAKAAAPVDHKAVVAAAQNIRQ